MAAEGLSSSTGAFLGSYDGTSKFFAPQKGKKVTWGNFMVNYYDTELSPDVTAVGGYKDVYLLPKNAPSTTVYYLPQQYIRGAHSYILKAKNDNLLSDEVPYEKLTTALMREGYSGLAPWKAMNYALYIYNSANVAEHHDCEGHFEVDDTGYAHSYPRLVSGRPTEDEVKDWNPLEQNN